MKTLLLVLVTAGVSGCAVYPAPHGGYGPPRAQVAPPVTVYGSGVYRYGDDGRAQPSPSRPRTRDQDRDGVPNRYDRDRDGDGVPNPWDARPSDPRYR